MGKRKERRLTVKTRVNRRVKFDLIAEPSGQKPENPLLLLGQYSDEELEDESGKEMSHDTRENSPVELDEQVKTDSDAGTEVDKDENLTCEKPDQEKKEHSSSLDV
ncbi:unnamed protein product [Lactuca virosa]|uniref:Uncharacterized protein n=1 Tax=Lactuca virosa TaxID=75947 RepID=A0AAU9P4Q1_9ASTR|nr:unnamed protein product [Lactuca virosa]